jgi:hypothetical protein
MPLRLFARFFSGTVSGLCGNTDVSCVRTKQHWHANSHYSRWWTWDSARVTRDRRHQVRCGIDVSAGVTVSGVPGSCAPRNHCKWRCLFCLPTIPLWPSYVVPARCTGPFLGHRPNSIATHIAGRWIGRGGPVSRSARSPDLDLFVWVDLKELRCRPSSMEDVMAELHSAVVTIDTALMRQVGAGGSRRRS